MALSSEERKALADFRREVGIMQIAVMIYTKQDKAIKDLTVQEVLALAEAEYDAFNNK